MPCVSCSGYPATPEHSLARQLVTMDMHWYRDTIYRMTESMHTACHEPFALGLGVENIADAR